MNTRIGLHVSAAGGVENAPEHAHRIGCEAFQFFSRSPRGGGRTPLKKSSVTMFRKRCRSYGFESVIHAPYYINFASSSNRISFGSVSAIREELERATELGVRYVVTHLGSRKDLGERDAVRQAIARIQHIFESKKRYTAILLLENSAGSTNVVGNTFEELAAVYAGINRKDVGICLDTAHLFASGYDVRTPDTVIRKYKKYLPLSAIKLVHANDSKADLGAGVDRHENIGDGCIGADAFLRILSAQGFRGRDVILEIPGDEKRAKKDVALLKTYRDTIA